MTREDEIRARLKGERAFTTMLLFDDIDYLLKENQRLRDALERISNHESTGYTAKDALAYDELKEISRQVLDGENDD